jgi:hypothetical protein
MGDLESLISMASASGTQIIAAPHGARQNKSRRYPPHVRKAKPRYIFWDFTKDNASRYHGNKDSVLSRPNEISLWLKKVRGLQSRTD